MLSAMFHISPSFLEIKQGAFKKFNLSSIQIIFCLAHDDFVLTSSVTGIVVALHGKETGAGDFLVHEVLEAGLPPQIEFPLKLSIASQSLRILHFNHICYNARLRFSI